MYARKNFTEEDIINYKMIPTDENNDCTKRIVYFDTLSVIRKDYSKNRTAESIFKSANNVTHISPEIIVINSSTNLNRGGTMATPENKATMAYHDYFKGLEEFLADAKQYKANINSTENYQTINKLRAKLAAQWNQTDAVLEQIITMIISSIPAGGAPPENLTNQVKHENHI